MQLNDLFLQNVLAHYGYRAETEQELLAALRQLAASPGTPPLVLAKLARTANTAIVARVAENYSTSIETLIALASHVDAEVRAAVTDNPKTPDRMLWRLAQDKSVDVRYRLAENCRVQRKLIELLLEDTNPYVAHRARLTLAKLDKQERSTAVIRRWLNSKLEAREG